MKSPMKKPGGFTLVEVMVALLIFALVSVALVRNATVSSRQAGTIRDRTIAWGLAENKMTGLRILPRTAEQVSGESTHRENTQRETTQRETISIGDAVWEIETRIEATEHEHIRRFLVRVHREAGDQPEVELIGFLGRY